MYLCFSASSGLQWSGKPRLLLLLDLLAVEQHLQWFQRQSVYEIRNDSQHVRVTDTIREYIVGKSGTAVINAEVLNDLINTAIKQAQTSHEAYVDALRQLLSIVLADNIKSKQQRKRFNPTITVPTLSNFMFDCCFFLQFLLLQLHCFNAMSFLHYLV